MPFNDLCYFYNAANNLLNLNNNNKNGFLSPLQYQNLVTEFKYFKLNLQNS